MKKEIENKIFNNYDNMEILQLVKYLLNVVINDVDYMNDLVEEKDILDLGNNYTINNEDFESIVSIIDTIKDIENYNEVQNEENE